MEFVGTREPPHDETPAVGVLLANLGTPDAPTPAALRRYLRDFLWDPRIIELPRWRWWLILHLFVLPTRPARSAAAYREVWTDEGSPLLVTSRRQAAAFEAALKKRFDAPLHVALGMRYGNPSLESALAELEAKHCRRILLFPLYPQYSATTTAATFDGLFDALKRRRWVPELRTIQSYHDDPGYIGALAASVREAWAEREPKRLLLSFHGIPQRYFDAGDPYYCHCQKTGRLLREELGLDEERLQVTFQSLFGREEWLKPYTDKTIQAWGKDRLESLDVLCPGFSADCLETIEEIDVENRGYFEAAGGGQFRYLPALNDRADHIEALTAVATRHLQGWV